MAEVGQRQISALGLLMKLSLSKNAELHLDVLAPSGSDLHSLIPVTVSSESHDRAAMQNESDASAGAENRMLTDV